MKALLFYFILLVIPIRAQQPIVEDSVNNMFPLGIGVGEQFIEKSWFQQLGSTYSMSQSFISDSLIINDTTYYLRGSTGYRYDAEANIAYYRNAGEDRIYLDFNMPDGYFWRKVGSDSIRFTIRREDVNYFGTTYSAFFIVRENFHYYVNNIGVIKTGYHVDQPYGDVTYTLISATIKDANNLISYFSAPKSVQFIFPSDTVVSVGKELSANLTVKHSLTRKNNSAGNSDIAVMYVDSVTVEYFKGSDTSSAIFNKLVNTSKTENWRVKIKFDSTQYSAGDKISYKFHVWDKALKPDYFSYPDTGYFSFVLNPVPVSVYEGENSLLSFTLSQNYPNPFNPETLIKYTIPENNFVQLKVYDITGKEVALLEEEYKEAGNHESRFIGKELASGLYFYTLRSGQYFEAKKMILLR